MDTGKDSNNRKEVFVGDLYLLSLSWRANFCCLQKKPDAKGKKEQCRVDWKGPKDGLVLHGLWPSFDDGSYPQYCLSHASPKDTDTSTLSGLQRHQWVKHGSCTKLSISQYFRESQRLFSSEIIKDLDNYLLSSAGGTVPTAQLLQRSRGGFADPNPNRGDFAISVTPYCQLKELTLCFEKKEGSDDVGEQIPCPPHIMNGERNNGAKKCKQLIVDESDKCQFITKSLQQVLRRDA